MRTIAIYTAWALAASAVLVMAVTPAGMLHTPLGAVGLGLIGLGLCKQTLDRNRSAATETVRDERDQ